MEDYNKNENGRTHSLIFSFLFFAALLSSQLAMGQNIKLEGIVYDNNVPLPFVSIWIKNTSIGTVSNTEGIFKLIVPQKYSTHLICFSSLGYKTKEIAIESIKNKVFLKKTDFVLPEISIMPDDSMLRIMQKAVNLIPENYLQAPSRQTGFYRTMLLADTSYQYFGEALLDVYKPSYKSKETGSVKILKSRINKADENNSMPPLYFFGGIYLPFLADFVQQRKAFLDPANIKDYAYSIDQIVEQEGMTVLKISFAPKFNSKGQYKGYFHLEKNTLTFLDFNFSYSENGREKRSKSLKSNLKSNSGSYLLKYGIIDNRYFLKYVLYKEEFQDLNSEKKYTKTNEYLTTEINADNTTPIPLQEQDMLSTVFSVRATSVTKSDWDDYTILAKEPIQLAYSEQQAKQILEHAQTKINLFSNKEKLIRIASRMQSSLYLSIAPTDYPDGQSPFLYKPSTLNTFQISKPIYQVKNQLNIGMSMGYNLSNRFSIFATQESSLNNNKWEAVSLGLSYNIGLKSYGKKLLLSPELSIASTDYGVFLGEFNNSESFRAEGKKFNSDKIKLYAGEKTFLIQPGFTIRKDLSRSLKLFVGIDCDLKLSSREVLFIHESSGFSMLRKKATMPLNRPQISYSITPLENWKDAYYLSTFKVKVGIILGR